MILKQTMNFELLSVNDLIGKLQAQDMNMHKKAKIKAQSTSLHQDPALYMGAKDSYADSSVSGPKVQTAFFSGNNASDLPSNLTGSDFCFNASATGFESNANTHSQQDGPKFSGQHCYICVNTQNMANTSIPNIV